MRRPRAHSGGGQPARCLLPRALRSLVRCRYVVVAVASLVATVAAPAASAAPRLRTLVVRASSSAHVDVTFVRTVTIDEWNLRVTGGREYAGFYFQPLSGRPAGGAGTVLFHRFRADGFVWAPLPIGPDDANTFAGRTELRTLPRGRYRLHVLADAPVEVRVPVAGFDTSRPLKATRPTRVSHLARDITDQFVPPAAAGTPGGAGRADLPFTVPSARTISFAALQMVSHGLYHTRNSSMGACIESADHPQCLNEDAKQFNGYHSPEYVHQPGELDIRASNVFVRHYFPSGLDPAKPGTQRAYYFAATTLHVDRVVAAALSISL